jgi:hypothetical protein
MTPNRPLIFVAAALVAAASWAPAAQPTPQEVVEKMLDAAGGRQAFAELGVLEFAIDEQETRTDGTTTTTKIKAYMPTNQPDTMRLDMDGGVTLVRTGPGWSGWATVGGVVDTRDQTPRMASGTAAQRLFPLVLPFALTLKGVNLQEVAESTFEGSPALRLRVGFTRSFFASPIMNTDWDLYISPTDYTLIAAQFQPSGQFTRVAKEGVRYRVMGTKRVDSVRLPSNILMEGIDANGLPTPHARIINITASVRGPWDPALFLHPDKLKALEDGELEAP